MFYEERAEERGEVAPGTKMGVRMWGTGEQWRLEEGRGAVCGQERLVRTKVDTHLGQLGAAPQTRVLLSFSTIHTLNNSL